MEDAPRNKIYNSRNYYRLLNQMQHQQLNPSTTVEITIGYLTSAKPQTQCLIYNSRNYYRLLNIKRLGTSFCLSTTVEITIGYLTYRDSKSTTQIYNSRNYYRLLNDHIRAAVDLSTTVEITIGYLTDLVRGHYGNLQQQKLLQVT